MKDQSSERLTQDVGHVTSALDCAVCMIFIIVTNEAD
jgi:hypothetical protein